MSYDLAYCNRIQASKVSCIMASLIQPTDKVASLEPDLGSTYRAGKSLS